MENYKLASKPILFPYDTDITKYNLEICFSEKPSNYFSVSSCLANDFIFVLQIMLKSDVLMFKTCF